MWGLRIYSTDYEPRELYAAGEAPADAEGLVESMVRFGDAPLALLADLGEDETRILWTFKGKRGTATNRTEYFVIDFVTDDSAPFAAFESMLRELHEGEWVIPKTGDVRWDLGFDLWRVSPVVEGAAGGQVTRIVDGVGAGGPIVEEVPDFRVAAAAVRALQEREAPCRVGVGREGSSSGIPGLDVLLVTETRDAQEPSSEPGSPGETLRWGGVAGTVVAGVLGAIALVSYLYPDGMALALMTPRIGLATLGGIVGAIVAFTALGWWLTPGRLCGTVAGDGPYFDPHWGGVWLGYGAFWGMAFPIMFFIGHRITGIGRGWYMFGDVVSLRGALPSMTVYLAGLYIFSLAVVSVGGWKTQHGTLDVRGLWAMGAAHLVYGVSVVFVLRFVGVG